MTTYQKFVQELEKSNGSLHRKWVENDFHWELWQLQKGPILLQHYPESEYCQIYFSSQSNQFEDDFKVINQFSKTDNTTNSFTNSQCSKFLLVRGFNYFQSCCPGTFRKLIVAVIKSRFSSWASFLDHFDFEYSGLHIDPAKYTVDDWVSFNDQLAEMTCEPSKFYN